MPLGVWQRSVARGYPIPARIRFVSEMPETRYAKTSDGVHIAYQTVGEGPFDLHIRISADTFSA